MKRLAFGLLVFTGCVPLTQYQDLEMRMSVQMAQRNQESKDIATCEERIKTLKEQLKQKPTTTTIVVPAVTKPIDQKELDEIKKKALIEAERSSKEPEQQK